MQLIRLVLLIGSLGAVTALAQQPAAPAAPAPGAAPAAGAGRAAGGARGGGGGGGRGAAVTFTPGQAIPLAALGTGADVDALTKAQTDLLNAAFKLPKNDRDIAAKVDALAKAESALALRRAGDWAKIKSSVTFTPEQMQLVIANNGLARGGNTSPGGTFAHDDYTGFAKIFDGKTFTGWNGETDGWIIGDDSLQMSTARLPGQHHIHFTGLPTVSPILKDFDFKVEMKINSTGGFNGGIQYRSRLLNGVHSANGQARNIYDAATIADPLGKPLPANVHTMAELQKAMPSVTGNAWQVSGYQFDCNNNMGSLYEGQGRGVVVNAGEIVQLFPNGLKFVIGRTTDTPATLIKPQGEWNQIEIIARGNTMIHMLNGKAVTITTDDDPMRRALQGMLSLQDEGGEIWYRNVYLKHLTPITAPAAK